MPPKKTPQYVPPRRADAPPPPKQRKQRAPRPRPEGLTDGEWKADCDRRSWSTTERRRRLAAQKVRDATDVAAQNLEAIQEAAAVAKQDLAEALAAAAMARSSGAPLFRPPTQQSVVSPAGNFSPSTPSAWGHTPSPDHSGFDPNIAFPHAAPALRPASVANSPAYASASSPSLRRGAIPFAAEMEELITAGSEYAAEDGDFTQEGDGAEQEGVEEDAEEETQEAPEEQAAAKGKKKRKNGEVPLNRVKWTAKEDECLAEAWKTVSLDPITGANQNGDTYWTRVKAAFDERKMVDPYFSGVFMERGPKAMASHWAAIQAACNKWHGIQEEVLARPESGASNDQKIARMFGMFRQDYGAEFKFIHVFTRLEWCEKWKEIRLQLSQTKNGVYNPDAPPPAASDGRPSEGNKKAKAAKAAKAAAPAAERLQSAIEKCIADVASNAAIREEKAQARWSELLTKQDAKLDLLRTSAAAKKRNTDLTFLATMATMDLAAMDAPVREWFVSERAKILAEMAPPVITPSAPPIASPTPTAATSPRSTPSTPDTPSTPAEELGEPMASALDLNGPL